MLKAQEESSQVSLFGEAQEVDLPTPEIPVVQEWPRLMLLNKEKEINGIYLSSHPLDDFKYEMTSLCSHELVAFQDMTKMSEFTIGGIITEVKHLTSRQGKPFGIFMMEDYSSNHEFRLFGEEYLKFKPFLDVNMMVMAKGSINRYTPRYEGAQERIEPKFREFMLLQDVMENQVKSMQLYMSLIDVNPENIEEINALVEEYKGSKPLNFMIFDPENQKVNVRMPGRSGSIRITGEVLKKFGSLDFVKLSLNS